MADLTFDKEIAALLVIDPHNDFISENEIIDHSGRSQKGRERTKRRRQPWARM